MASDRVTMLRKSRLAAERVDLQARYGVVTMDEMDGTWVHIHRMRLPEGWNREAVAILIDIPHGNPGGYPHVPPMWFWTDRSLCAANGAGIQHFFTTGSHAASHYIEKEWGHFCVHVQSWSPAGGNELSCGDNLLSYVELISSIFLNRQELAR